LPHQSLGVQGFAMRVKSNVFHVIGYCILGTAMVVVVVEI